MSWLWRWHGDLLGLSLTNATPVPAQTPQRQDAPMPPPASTIYERLRAFIAERMHMSPIDQPLRL